jgi:AcrR family transcriptional regulator
VSPSNTAPAARRVALAPQRRPGKERVAALLRGGAEVIAERGFEATTMAEIAARAGAPIGSLYRFFPNKDALADALMQRFVDLTEAAFEKIEARPDASSLDEFADALLTALVDLRGETHAAVVALLDARADSAAWREQLCDRICSLIIRTLKARTPHLGDDEAQAMAVLLLQNMKARKSLDAERDAAVINELHAMTRLYLKSKLGG